MTLGLVLIASIGKFGGAFIGGEIGGLTRRESLALGIAMNARGSTEVIIASIGLSIGALTSDLYTIIVAMAIATTMAMPPTLRWALGRLPIGGEKRRLEREEFEANGFVANIERILLTVDDSPSGQLASRLARLVGGPRGSRPRRCASSKGVAWSQREAKRQPSSGVSPPAHGSAARRGAPADQAVASEARKGYDFLMVGLEPARAEAGGFHSKIVEVARSFEGTVAVMVARGALSERPLAVAAQHPGSGERQQCFAARGGIRLRACPYRERGRDRRLRGADGEPSRRKPPPRALPLSRRHEIRS